MKRAGKAEAVPGTLQEGLQTGWQLAAVVISRFRSRCKGSGPGPLTARFPT